MRVRPDGSDLLRTARAVLDSAILPNLASVDRDRAQTIARAMRRGEELLARDGAPAAGDLAELDRAHALLRGAVLEALPRERRYDARLTAKAIAVAARQLENGSAIERAEYERLAALLGIACDAPDANGVRCALAALNGELCARIRAGEADEGTAAYAATLAHLEAMTDEALSESNPAYRRRAARTAPATAPDVAKPVADPLDLWLQIGDAFGDVLAASGNAALSTQTGMVGWFTQRLAASPNVPMFAVEGAHQMHDLSVAIADTSSAFMMLALAPFRYRRAEQRHVHATRSL